MTIFTFFSLFWLQILNLPALLQNKSTRLGPFRSVLQYPDRARNNQSARICLRLALPYNRLLNAWLGVHQIHYFLTIFKELESLSVRTTRNSQMLHIPLHKTATGQRIFYSRTAKLWNSLDPVLNQAETDLKRLQDLPEEKRMLNFLETY